MRRANRLRFDGPAVDLAGEAAWEALIQDLWNTPWIVYPKATARNPERALDYLGRYTHRVAIGDHRLRSLEDGNITFDWRDRADGNKVKQMTLPVQDFIARFMLHLLPHGFAKVRAYGWLAGRNKTATLAAIRSVLKVNPPQLAPADESTTERIARLTGVDVTLCPLCKTGHLVYARQLHPSRAGP